jgi:hypothetical protein
MSIKKMSPSKIRSLSICECGAVSIELDKGHYSMTAETFEKVFGFTVNTGLYVNCNHCINNWGIDLCGCGSGEPFGECKEGYPECKKPIQKLGEYDQP